ncbi:6834_t:CDS:2 [Funneliformis geosporum]|nr:6834_t:CDS:2 [Funneliformis geosporum]
MSDPNFINAELGNPIIRRPKENLQEFQDTKILWKNHLNLMKKEKESNLMARITKVIQE